MSEFIACLDSIKKINDVLISGTLSNRQKEIIIMAINRIIRTVRTDREPPLSKLELTHLS